MTVGHQIRGVKTVTLYIVTNSSLMTGICKCNKAEYLGIFLKVAVSVYSLFLPAEDCDKEKIFQGARTRLLKGPTDCSAAQVSYDRPRQVSCNLKVDTYFL